MDLGVAIVSYNTRALTTDCLRSLAEALAADAAAGRGLRVRVCVVDNASSDGSAEAIAALLSSLFIVPPSGGSLAAQDRPDGRTTNEEGPGEGQGRPDGPATSGASGEGLAAELVASAENLGFARGSNLAIERLLAGCDPPRHLMLLNPDTLVPPRSLPLLVSFLDAHPRTGVVGPRLVYGDGSFQHGAFRFPSLSMALFDFWTINHRLLDSRLNGRYPRAWYEGGAPFAIDHPLGAALTIRRQTAEQVGLLDPGYFMYCEEIDWCLRVKKAGWEVYCVPEAVITHLGGQSTRQFREAMFVALWRSRYRLFDQHYKPLYRFLVRRIVRAGLARDARRLRRACRDGEITAEQLEARLAAYRRVRDL